MLLLVGACGGSESQAAIPTNSASSQSDSVSSPTTRCVYNQAYQENFEADSADTLTALARNCYVLVDPFVDPVEDGPASEIQELIQLGNEVGCYTSVGTGEDWRPDFAELRPHLVEEPWAEWEGEYFVSDVEGALVVMKQRLDLFASVGCQWVEFDNMDWAYDSGQRARHKFEANEEEAEIYVNDLCLYAHSLDMLCMAKNVRLVENIFDGGTFESFPDDLDWWDHGDLQAFLDEGKLAIIVHYDETDCERAEAVYADSYGPGISVLCEDHNLEAYRHS